MLVICRYEPVSDIKSPPKDAYAVLSRKLENEKELTMSKTYTISAVPPSNRYTLDEYEPAMVEGDRRWRGNLIIELIPFHTSHTHSLLPTPSFLYHPVSIHPDPSHLPLLHPLRLLVGLSPEKKKVQARMIALI